MRDPYRPLGEVWVAGRGVRHEPLPAAYAPRRACVVSDGDGVRIVARDDAPERPDGDLVQAGPLLVADGAVAFDPAGRPRGLHRRRRAVRLRHHRRPPSARGVRDRATTTLIAVACDGRRSDVDAGLSMLELAAVMVDLGAERAINLDGGGSTTLVHRGHLLNRPYSNQDQPAPQSRRIVTALALEPVA